MSRPTIRDVARLAGVSHQTVSRVINGNEMVSTETRGRVVEAITKLNYQPNAIARSMAQGRTSTLACLSPNLTDFTFASIIEGAETEARKQGYFLLSSSVEDECSFRNLVHELVPSRRIEGLVVINPYVDNRFMHVPLNWPVVYVGSHPRSELVDSVTLNDYSGASLAVNHLISLGYQEIAMITGPSLEDCVRDRNKGFFDILQKAELSVDRNWIIEGDWSATSGFRAFRQLFHSGKMPKAIFAQNDRMAIGVIRAAHDAGFRIPEDLSVIGFDDMPLSSYFDPPLSTIRQDPFSIGREAAQLLIRRIKTPDVHPEHISLPAELIVRQSTGSVNNKGGEIQAKFRF